MKDTQIKLVTVVRNDISPGYQIAQSNHSVAEFAHKYPKHFTSWITESNYIVSLSIKNEFKLEHLLKKLELYGAKVVGFREPDIGDELTSLCFYGTPELRKITNKLNLALKQ